VKASEHSAGVFRAYATQLNNVASDGVARNSPFTAALLKHIETKGISIQELMMRVRKSVMEETKNQQIPWEEAALNDSFYFVPSFGAPPVAATPAKSGPRPSGGTYGTAGAARKPAPSTSRLPPNIGAGVGAGL
jgi:uncharacterized caspase-like protein